MDTKGIERWEKMKSMGKAKYVITNGAIGWGIPVALIACILDTAIDKHFSLAYIASMPFLINLALTLVIFLIVGVFFGIYLWNYMEKTYGKRKKY